jgi:hypothetical protein
VNIRAVGAMVIFRVRCTYRYTSQNETLEKNASEIVVERWLFASRLLKRGVGTGALPAAWMWRATNMSVPLISTGGLTSSSTTGLKTH